MRRSYCSFAKINLHLQVRGRRPDGYHELETIFQSIDLCDTIEVAPLPGRPGIRFRVVEGEAPSGPENLVVRAATGLLERFAPTAGLAIDLRKRIPLGGGLGGGSSNAATTLRAVVETLGLDVSAAELEGAARGLGADVPFFLVGGTAVGTGRGDSIRPLEPEIAQSDVLLVLPPAAVSTAQVFESLGRVRHRDRAAELESWLADVPPTDPWGSEWWNDLEPTTRSLYSEVDAVYTPLIQAGASCVRLSGSGSTVFARFPDSADVQGLEGRLPVGTEMRWARTLNREAFVERSSGRGVGA